MISRYQVWLNDESMSNINNNLLILDVSYEQPKYQMETAQIVGREGMSIGNKYRETASVTITFELHIYDITDRQSALDDVIAWARNGGILKTNDRDGQRLVCVCDKFPSITSVKKWTDALSITFTAYGIPYWEDEEATTLTLNGTNASGTLAVDGNGGDAFVSCVVTAVNNITSFRVDAGDTFIQLDGINVPSGGSVAISYENGILSIKQGAVSLLNKRTALSSDDLVVPSGDSSTFSLIASDTASATFSVRGCWM